MKIRFIDISKFSKILSRAVSEGKEFVFAYKGGMDPENFDYLNKEQLLKLMLEIADELSYCEKFACHQLLGLLQKVRGGKLPIDYYLEVDRDNSLLVDLSGLSILNASGGQLRKALNDAKMDGQMFGDLPVKVRMGIINCIGGLKTLKGGDMLAMKVWQKNAPVNWKFPVCFMRINNHREQPSCKIRKSDYKSYVDVRFKR